MKKWIVFIATIVSLCSNVARANDLEDAIDAHYKGNHAKALELLPPHSRRRECNSTRFTWSDVP